MPATDIFMSPITSTALFRGYPVFSYRQDWSGEIRCKQLCARQI